MSVTKLLPDDYRSYVEKFHRITYKNVFEPYAAQIQPQLSDFSDVTQAETAASSLISRAADLISAQRFGKKLRLLDIRHFFLFYLLPAVGQDENCGQALITAILDCWNAKYPENKLVYMPYEEICSGFRNTYMGFEMGGRK